MATWRKQHRSSTKCVPSRVPGRLQVLSAGRKLTGRRPQGMALSALCLHRHPSSHPEPHMSQSGRRPIMLARCWPAGQRARPAPRQVRTAAGHPAGPASHGSPRAARTGRLCQPSADRRGQRQWWTTQPLGHWPPTLAPSPSPENCKSGEQVPPPLLTRRSSPHREHKQVALVPPADPQVLVQVGDRQLPAR